MNTTTSEATSGATTTVPTINGTASKIPFATKGLTNLNATTGFTNLTATNKTAVDDGKSGKATFLNLDEGTLIMIGGVAALVIVVLVVIVIVVVYIRCRSRGRRQVNIAPQQGESEAVSGDTVPLT